MANVFAIAADIVEHTIEADADEPDAVTRVSIALEELHDARMLCTNALHADALGIAMQNFEVFGWALIVMEFGPQSR